MELHLEIVAITVKVAKEKNGNGLELDNDMKSSCFYFNGFF